MTKIEEIFKKHNSGFSHLEQYPPWYVGIVEMMKEYAEWYAKECLKIAADSAIIDTEFIGDDTWAIETSFVDKESIIEIKLPEHE